ncbi:hypothetical protein ACFY0A_37700 [Streptomyces sp. NPDC001698]|uniref:hypothetical protein n=1 Tax=Streptomyces sp. NPDC001698 TaxID=3364601 RepID=UPI0036B9C27C
MHASASVAVKPTVVLVHGAWADASGWTPVAEELEKQGYTVKAPPNPLRGLGSDARYISNYLKQINSPTRCTTTSDSARTVGFPPRELRDRQLRVRAE